MNDPYSSLRDDYEKTWEIVEERNQAILTLKERIATLEAENQRLRALVAVGREMADECYIQVEESENTEECSVCLLCGDGTEDHTEKHTVSCIVGKWRSLEGKG